MTKAEYTISRSLSAETIEGVSSEALPLTNSIDLLYQLESSGNVTKVNEIVDDITNQAVGKESNIDKIIIEQPALRTNSTACHTACHRS